MFQFSLRQFLIAVGWVAVACAGLAIAWRFRSAPIEYRQSAFIISLLGILFGWPVACAILGQRWHAAVWLVGLATTPFVLGAVGWLLFLWLFP